MISW